MRILVTEMTPLLARLCRPGESPVLSSEEAEVLDAAVGVDCGIELWSQNKLECLSVPDHFDAIHNPEHPTRVNMGDFRSLLGNILIARERLRIYAQTKKE